MSYKAENLNKLSNIKHCFFGRKGGFSKGVCEGLNVGFQHDEPEVVVKNRKLIEKYFEADLSLIIQKHTNQVIYIDNIEVEETIADAFVTDKKNIILGIKTADCVPILFADGENQVIGACHAGWRGAFAGIIENTILKMIKIGAKRENIIAAIGPSIAQESYEVDEQFYLEFINQDKINDKYFIDSVNPSRYLFDLPKYCFDKLKCEGIENVSLSNIDTYEVENYFSYRRSFHNQEIGCGRQLSAIVIK